MDFEELKELDKRLEAKWRVCVEKSLRAKILKDYDEFNFQNGKASGIEFTRSQIRELSYIIKVNI